ncbi:tachykinin-like peptides receptor 99D [Oratosquilla oratoria]|uniref:tachykinin-like peptides receptor 99D n=1 Tax=Oratosquilla oratoria TaxID=337810 RepID=UPI003F76A5C4
MGRKTTILIVAWIWIVSFSVSIPNFLFFTTEPVPTPHGGVRVVCYGSWPDGDPGESQFEHVHTVVLMVLTYILPVVGMGFTYSRMGAALWGSQSIGERTPRHIETIRSKRKVVKMMIVVVVMFAVCWLPYHLYFILYTYIPSINLLTNIQDIYLAIYWLAMSNSMYNPMIYCWLNSRFRNGFRQVFSWWLPCVASERITVEMPRAHTTRVSYSGSPEARHRDGGTRQSSSYMQVSDSTHLAPLVQRSPRSAR